jgi:hypothetical protein
VITSANTREPSTDDDYINMFRAHQPTSNACSHRGLALQP